MNEKIFISIASYRDPELLPTIRDIISTADNPQDLVFSIAWQRSVEDSWDNLSEFDSDPRFKIIDIDYAQSKGACWARHLCQSQYTDEGYTLQLDSHHRFVPGWDTKCKNMVKDLQANGYAKPLLTAYLNAYNPKNDPDGRSQGVWKLNFDKVSTDGIVLMIGGYMEPRTTPFRGRFFSGHFAFTVGQFNTEVPYDPNIYFHGEEITMAVRAWTHGYDIFCPYETIAWHEYTRQNRTKHWDDHKKWYELNSKSVKRVQSLLGIRNEPPMDVGIYGLGNVRTLAEYEKYAGIRFSDGSIQDYTLQHNEAPNPIYDNPLEYENSFAHDMSYNLSIPKDKVINIDWDAWAIIFEDISGAQIHRHDADRNEINNIKKSNAAKVYNVFRQFRSAKKPHCAIIWPYSHDPQIGWGEKIQILLN